MVFPITFLSYLLLPYTTPCQGGCQTRMKSSEEMDDMDKDSEFDSEAEDIEFRLYQQLYFESNPDGTEADTVSRSPIEEQHEGEVNPNKTHDEQIAQLDGCQLDMLEMKSLASHKIPTIAFQNHETQSSQFDNCIYINTEEGTEVALTDYSANVDLGNTEECSIGQKGKVNNNCDPVVSFSDGIPLVKENEISLQSARERLSSTCSDGSIRGSVPLDALYCNLVTSEEEDDTIDSRLILKNIETNDQERIKEKSNKRKRGNISCSDDEEDSRCNNLMSIASKNIVNEGDVQQLEEDSNSEDDVHVLPPPKQKNPEVLTLESSSDSEEKIRMRNGTCIKSNNNKYQKIEKPPSSSLKAINKEGNSRSVHQISEIRGELGKKERDVVAAGSESDSCDVDMPEATKGTDLTLNIDKRLTGWIKTITKDAPTNKRKNDVTKNSQNKRSCSSVDFTKGRPDTTTKPSCEKWTQSMANFYDSDVSDEFDVSEIHRQQSGSPADWPLIAADYQITRRRRYYNVSERCRRCREEGHPISKCPRVPVCHLCSSTNHCCRSKCPENCCFKCGGEPHYFCPIMDMSRTCHLCSSPGHKKNLCPDLWRRFHLTTNGLTAKTPIGCLPRPLGERYCYCCSRQGHYGHDCPVKFQNRSYVNLSQSVVSYSCPVTLFGSNFAVNVEGAPSPSLNEDVTAMHIKLRDVGRIIGKKGAMVQSIIKDSGAHVKVVHEGKPQVLLFGPSEARLKAQDIIKVLLGVRKSINKEVTEALNNSSSCHYLGNDVRDNVAMDVGNSKSSQNIWNWQFSSHTDRKKGLILGNIKVFMKIVRTKKHMNLSPAIKKLKKFKLRKESTPSEQLSEIEKKYLNLVAMNALANSDYGNSDEIQEKLTALLNLVESHPSSTISEDLCVQLTDTVQPFLNPSLEKLDELLQIAEKNNLAFVNHKRMFKKYQNEKKGKAKKSKKIKDVRKEKGKDDKKIKPVKKIKGKIKKIKPVKKEKGKNDKETKPVEKEKGENDKETKPVEKEKGENDKETKPVEKERGENDKGIKPVKKKEGKKIKKIKSVEKEKGENDKKIKPVKKKEGKKVEKIKPVEKEKGKNDKEINPVNKEKVKNAPKINPVKKRKAKNASKIKGVKKGKAKIDKEINDVKKAKAKNDKGIKIVKKGKAKAEIASKVKKNPKKKKKMAFKRTIVMKKTKPKKVVKT